MAGVKDLLEVCNALKNREQKEFCQLSIAEQCIGKMDDVCIETFPKDSKAAFKCFQDMNSGVALKNQTKNFVVELPTAKGKKFNANDLKECANVVRDKVIQFGAPKTRVAPKTQAAPKTPPPPPQKPSQKAKPAATAPTQSPQTKKADPLAQALSKFRRAPTQPQSQPPPQQAKQKTPAAKPTTPVAPPKASENKKALNGVKIDAKKDDIPGRQMPTIVKIPRNEAAAVQNGAPMIVKSKASKEQKEFIERFFKERILTKAVMDKMAEVAKRYGASPDAQLSLKVNFQKKQKSAQVELDMSAYGGMKGNCAIEIWKLLPQSQELKMDEATARKVFNSKDQGASFDIIVPVPKPAAKKAK